MSESEYKEPFQQLEPEWPDEPGTYWIELISATGHAYTTPAKVFQSSPAGPFYINIHGKSMPIRDAQIVRFGREPIPEP
jgi:hypothetical protein